MKGWPTRRLLAPALLVASLWGCGATEDEVSDEGVIPPPPADAITKTTQNGPVKATVTVWPPKPSLAEPIYVRLTVEAERGVSVSLPFQTGQLGDAALGRFRVAEFSDVARETADHLVDEHTYTLQARSSGRHRLPPFRLEMTDQRGAGAAKGAAAKATEVLTEEIALEVAEIPVEKVTASLSSAAGPLSTSVGQRPWWQWAALVAFAALWLVLGVALYRRWKLRQAVARQVSAYERAIAELHALERDGAPDEHRADAWFVQLSAIVRRYLESRYDIRAPELTTEEFLQEALRAGRLGAAHRGLLQTFLERCDRVKFAAYRPGAQESLETLSAARGFVEDTRLRELALASTVPAAKAEGADAA